VARWLGGSGEIIQVISLKKTHKYHDDLRSVLFLTTGGASDVYASC
jgi:hypothetical protein